MGRHETNRAITIEIDPIEDGKVFSGIYCKCGADLVWCVRCRNLGTFPLRCGNGCLHECGVIGKETKLLDDIAAKAIPDAAAVIPDNFLMMKDDEEKEVAVTAAADITRYERYRQRVNQRGREYRKKLREAGLCQTCGWKKSVPIYKNGYCKFHHEQALQRSNASTRKWIRNLREEHLAKKGNKPTASLIKTEVVPGVERPEVEPLPTYRTDDTIPQLITREIFNA